MPGLPLITSEAFETLEAEWAALHARVPAATPFLHPAWHAVWLRHFGGDSAAVFLSIRREEELIGVAALDMDREMARELGDHNVRDYAGPLALAGEEAAVAAGILEWLREDLTSAATFWGLPADAPMTAAIEQAALLGWAVERRHEAVCPGVALDGDFEAYVAGLSKKDRHELRRRCATSKRPGQRGSRARTRRRTSPRSSNGSSN